MTLNTSSTDLDAHHKPLTKKEVRALGEEIVASVHDGSGGYCEPYAVVNTLQTPPQHLIRYREFIEHDYKLFSEGKFFRMFYLF